jgi:HSP20 family protein
MLMRTDPFRDLDRLTQQFFGGTGSANRPTVVPMDAYREGDQFVVNFDLPGVAPDSIDLGVERNVLTVTARRDIDFGENAEVIIAERPSGIFSRQLFLSDTLDTENITASYDAGVLTLRIPAADRARRRIEISSSTETRSPQPVGG